MKRTFLTFLLTFTLAFCELAHAADIKVNQPAEVGVLIVELSSGREIVAKNTGKTFIPASTVKCVTAAAVQISKNKNFSFSTAVETRGRIVDGVLNGNLYIIGGGDPTLCSRHITGRRPFTDSVIDWLRNEKIDSIAGDLIIDASIYPSIGISPYWLIEDTAWEYGAGLYGINYRDNGFEMTAFPGEPCYDAPYDIEVVNELRQGKKTDVMAFRGEGSCLLTLTGTVVGSKGYSSRYSLPVPWLAMHDDLSAAMKSSGIGVGGRLDMRDDGPRKKMIYESPIRDEILTVMIHKSHNLFAEGMLRSLTLDKPEPRGFTEAVAQERKVLEDAGIDFSYNKIVDGSGLAITNRVTPAFMSSVLGLMSNSGDYVNLFPKVGKEGTVKRLLSGTRLQGRLALKSGSMSGVLCYAGYKLDASGRATHSVVVMVNGFNSPAAEVRKAVADFLLSVF